MSGHLCFLFWKHFVSPFIDWQLNLWKFIFFLWSGYDFPIWTEAGEVSMVSAHSSFCRLPLIPCNLIYHFWGLFPMLLESFSGKFPNPACWSFFPIIYSSSFNVPSFRWRLWSIWIDFLHRMQDMNLISVFCRWITLFILPSSWINHFISNV